MSKYSQQVRNDFSPPTSMTDLAYLMALCLMLGFRSDLIDEVSLPRLEAAPAATATAKDESDALQIVVRSSGELQLAEEAIELSGLAARLGATAPEARLQLLLEVDQTGLGHAERLVQIIDTLQTARIPNPLTVRVARDGLNPGAQP